MEQQRFVGLESSPRTDSPVVIVFFLGRIQPPVFSTHRHAMLNIQSLFFGATHHICRLPGRLCCSMPCYQRVVDKMAEERLYVEAPI